MDHKRRVKTQTTTVIGFGQGGPNGASASRFEVGCEYCRAEDGVYHLVLRAGTPWRLDGVPVAENGLPDAWRHEVALRMPDDVWGEPVRGSPEDEVVEAGVAL